MTRTWGGGKTGCTQFCRGARRGPRDGDARASVNEGHDRLALAGLRIARLYDIIVGQV